MRMISLVVVLIAFLFGNFARAEGYLVREHLQSTLDDGFDWTGISIIAGGMLGVALAQPHDYEHRTAWSENKKMSTSASKIGDLLGTGLWGASVVVGQYFLDRERSYSHTEALLLSFGTTSILKFVNGRHRPDSDNRHSMPSGHTSTAFTTATHLAYSYGAAAGIPAYAIATFVAASRWSDDAHWLSDTVAGATIGLFWGRATASHHLLAVQPVVQQGFYGVQISASY